MLSEPRASGEALHANAAKGVRLASFQHRASLSEWMDEPCSYEEFRACLHDLAQVNRLTLAYRPTLLWLRRLWRSQAFDRRKADAPPLHIVDVGFGQGDMLRQVARWARRHRVAVRLTGIDLNPYAARAAKASTARSTGSPGDLSIEWITGDAFSYAAAWPIDVVISSLFTHHLPDAEIVRFLAWMEQHARYGWWINDLHRGALPYYGFRLLARGLGWHPFVQHDGPVSIRRSFQAADWRGYCAAAGLGAGVVIEEFRPSRLCVGRIKP